MSMIIRPVFGFGSFPDGRLRAGPFHFQNPSELHVALDRHGIHPGMEGDAGMVSLLAGGIMLSAAGAGVRGYFLDGEGLEAPGNDLDRFILATVRAGAACSIAGHWSPDAGRAIISEALAIHDGRHVTWTMSRVIHHADGRYQVIARPAPAVIASHRSWRRA